MQKKRRIILVILLFVFVFFAAFFITRAIQEMKNKIPDLTLLIPKVDSALVEITELSRDTTKMNSWLLLRNPLPYKVSADSIAYEFFISDSSVMKNTFKEPASLKASDTSWIYVPVTIYNQKLISILDRSEKLGFDSVYYEVRASFYSKLIKDKKFSFKIGRMLPLLHIPEINITKVMLDSAYLDGLKLLVHTNVLNENVFPIRARNLSYRFFVSGNKWITGQVPTTIDIREKSSTEIIFPVYILLKEVGKTVFTLFKKGKKVPYSFELKMTTVAEKNVLNGTRVIIKNAGTIGEIMEMRKELVKKNHRR